MTRRAVYVCTDPGVPTFGRKGCSVHVQAVLGELLRRDASVDLVAARTGGDPPSGLAAVRVHELGRPSARDAAAAERNLVALDAVARRTVDAIVASAPRCEPPVAVIQRYGLWSCEVMEAVRGTGAIGVLELNAPLIDEQARHRTLVDRRTAEDRTRRAIRAAHRPYAVSASVAHWASELAGVPVEVVPNGVDPARFAGPRPIRTRSPFTVVFVGTFRPWHGLDALTEAMEALAGSGRTVRLLLVGDGPERAATVTRAERAGLDVEVVGAVAADAVPALLARADAAVAPYPAGDHYFSPLKVAEYLAAGLPTVAAAVGDLPALFGDGDELLLVPPGDGAALGAALASLHDDVELRARLGRGGRAAAERLTWTRAFDRVLAPFPGWLTSGSVDRAAEVVHGGRPVRHLLGRAS